MFTTGQVRGWGRWAVVVLLGLGGLGGLLGLAQGEERSTDSGAQAAEVAEAARLMQQVGQLYGEGQYDAALPLAQRALAILEGVLGPQHPDVATTLGNLALLYQTKGDYGRAEPLYQRALTIQEQASGPEHPLVATVLNHLALLSRAQGHVPQVVAFVRRAADIHEHHLARILATGVEAQKRAYLATLTKATSFTVSLQAQGAPTDLSARRAALTTILRRKGRVLDVMADALQTLRRHLAPEDQARLEQVAALRAQLATLVLRGPGHREPAAYRQQVAALEAQLEPLEAALSARSAAFRTEAQPVTLAQVQAALPEDTALVEVVWYRPHQPQAKWVERWGAPRYVAYVLHR